MVALLSRLFGGVYVFISTNFGCQSAEPWSDRRQSCRVHRFSITIKDRKVDAAQRLITVKRGETLELEFATDETAELHLHGYDKLVKVGPSAPAVLRVDATIAGRFSIEAHGFRPGKAGRRGREHVVLLYLEVHPR